MDFFLSGLAITAILFASFLVFSFIACIFFSIWGYIVVPYLKGGFVWRSNRLNWEEWLLGWSRVYIQEVIWSLYFFIAVIGGTILAVFTTVKLSTTGVLQLPFNIHNGKTAEFMRSYLALSLGLILVCAGIAIRKIWHKRLLQREDFFGLLKNIGFQFEDKETKWYKQKKYHGFIDGVYFREKLPFFSVWSLLREVTLVAPVRSAFRGIFQVTSLNGKVQIVSLNKGIKAGEKEHLLTLINQSLGSVDYLNLTLVVEKNYFGAVLRYDARQGQLTYKNLVNSLAFFRNLKSLMQQDGLAADESLDYRRISNRVLAKVRYQYMLEKLGEISLMGIFLTGLSTILHFAGLLQASYFNVLLFVGALVFATGIFALLGNIWPLKFMVLERTGRLIPKYNFLQVSLNFLFLGTVFILIGGTIIYFSRNLQSYAQLYLALPATIGIVYLVTGIFGLFVGSLKILALKLRS